MHQLGRRSGAVNVAGGTVLLGARLRGSEHVVRRGGRFVAGDYSGGVVCGNLRGIRKRSGHVSNVIAR